MKFDLHLIFNQIKSIFEKFDKLDVNKEGKISFADLTLRQEAQTEEKHGRKYLFPRRSSTSFVPP